MGSILPCKKIECPRLPRFGLSGETRSYAGSVFGRVKPGRSLFDGGLGAIELKARYAYADFSAATESGTG